jgi:[protein-PII] uridylyltransferase
MVCTWDRPGLLAKVAATFTSLRINILQADVYTRTDNLVLDVFEISGRHEHEPPDGTRLSQLSFLLESALGDPRAALTVWTSEPRHKTDPAPALTPVIEFANDGPGGYTALRVVAPDRLGLLYDLLQTLTDAGVNIAQAVVATDKEVARDVFYLTDLEGRKITDEACLDTLRKALRKAIRTG